jgi:hypothetical protein
LPGPLRHTSDSGDGICRNVLVRILGFQWRSVRNLRQHRADDLYFPKTSNSLASLILDQSRFDRRRLPSILNDTPYRLRMLEVESHPPIKYCNSPDKFSRARIALARMRLHPHRIPFRGERFRAFSFENRESAGLAPNVRPHLVALREPSAFL